MFSPTLNGTEVPSRILALNFPALGIVCPSSALRRLSRSWVGFQDVEAELQQISHYCCLYWQLLLNYSCCTSEAQSRCPCSVSQSLQKCSAAVSILLQPLLQTELASMHMGQCHTCITRYLW